MLSEDVLDEVLDYIDDIRADLGDVVDFDHVDETTKTVFVCRTKTMSLDELEELRDLLRREAPQYRVGSIVRHQL